MAAEQHEQTEAKQEVSEQDETATGRNGSTLRLAATAGALAAAAGTTVYFTRKAMQGNGGRKAGPLTQATESVRESVGSVKDSVGSGVKDSVSSVRNSVGGGEVDNTGSRVDDFFTVLRTRGWDAANDMLIPVAENAARAAGAYAADNSPDFVRDTLLPKFVDGFTEAHQSAEEQSVEKSS